MRPLEEKILRVLLPGTEMSGLQFIAAGCGGVGPLYPALRSLERRGLLRSREVDGPPERAGRPRRMYSITADGYAAVNHEPGDTA